MDKYILNCARIQALNAKNPAIKCRISVNQSDSVLKTIQRNIMLYSVTLFCSLAVIESVDCAYKITCDTADTLKSCVIAVVASAALGADIADYTGISAAGISVDGVVDRTVADTRFLHTSDDLLKCFKIL